MAHSKTIRELIMEFLKDNLGSRWTSVRELNARAANYAGCSITTSERWIYQFTRVGMPFVLIEGVGVAITLEARGE